MNYRQITVNRHTQIAKELKQQLAISDLQLIGEFTFNSEDDPREAVNFVRVSDRYQLNIYQWKSLD